jgi:ABC-type glycerol-3-phosphate transport system permease component
MNGSTGAIKIENPDLHFLVRRRAPEQCALATFVIGLLAGYALAQLSFRGPSVVFNAMLLILILTFQLFMIPLYVLIVRTYGLADSYLGSILAGAVVLVIPAVVVFVIFQRQFIESNLGSGVDG